LYRDDLIDLKTFFEEFIQEVKDELIKDPSCVNNGLLWALVEESVNPKDEEKITDEELLSTCTFLVFAGHETTTNMLTSGMYELLNNPFQLSLLMNDFSLIPNAVEEFVRLHPPIQSISVTTTKDVSIPKTSMSNIISEQALSKCPFANMLQKKEPEFITIPKGSNVVMQLGKANRDPSRYSEPSQLDITRNNSRQLGFSRGRHLCLGRHLAKLESQIVFKGILTKLKNLKLVQTENLAWRENLALKGLKELHISWENNEISKY